MHQGGLATPWVPGVNGGFFSFDPIFSLFLVPFTPTPMYMVD